MDDSTTFWTLAYSAIGQQLITEAEARQIVRPGHRKQDYWGDHMQTLRALIDERKNKPPRQPWQIAAAPYGLDGNIITWSVLRVLLEGGSKAEAQRHCSLQDWPSIVAQLYNLGLLDVNYSKNQHVLGITLSPKTLDIRALQAGTTVVESQPDIAVRSE